MSSDWLSSYGDANRYDFLDTRPILMDGFVHNAEGYAKSCAKGGGTCAGSFTDLNGERSMGTMTRPFSITTTTWHRSSRYRPLVLAGGKQKR